jgi:hypothetical protein
MQPNRSFGVRSGMPDVPSGYPQRVEGKPMSIGAGIALIERDLDDPSLR